MYLSRKTVRFIRLNLWQNQLSVRVTKDRKETSDKVKVCTVACSINTHPVDNEEEGDPLTLHPTSPVTINHTGGASSKSKRVSEAQIWLHRSRASLHKALHCVLLWKHQEHTVIHQPCL